MSELLTHIARGAGILAILALVLLAGADNTRAGAAFFVVNSTGDQADAVANGVCDVGPPTNKCTLRAAFSELVAGTEVRFNIPGCPPACTISPNGVLPQLANNNLIDGTTQPGYNGTPLITIDGTNITNGPGINLGNSTIGKIRGMVIRDVDDDHGIVGGAVESFEISDSILSGNAGAGVALYPPLNPPPVTLRIDVTNSQFTGNINGILAGSSGGPFHYAEVSGSAFSGNSNRGVEMYLSGYLHFDSNVASNNAVDGAYIVRGAQGPIITASLNDNIFEGNGGNGVTTGANVSLQLFRNQARDNSAYGMNVSEEISESVTIQDNVIEDNVGNGLVARATGSTSFTDNVIRRNGGNGANITYEQYVGSGTPPTAAFTLAGNQFLDNFGTALHAPDEFLNFSLNANNNTFESNGQGIYTSAYTVGISDSTFTGSAYGVTSADPDATGLISGSTFASNATAIYLNGPGVGVAFNRITGNDIGVINPGLGVASAENNWWGCNEGPGLGGCDSTGQAVDSTPWLVMTPSANPTSIPYGANSTILADFTINSAGVDTLPSGGGGSQTGYHIPDDAMVEFGTDLGNFDGEPTLQAPTSAGVAGVTLTADEGPGTAQVTAGLDAEEVQVEVAITGGPPTPSPSPSPSPPPSGAPRKQGDLDCNNAVNGRDALYAAAHAASSPFSQTGSCPVIGSGSPQFGDVTCANGVGVADAVAILQYSAGVTIKPPQPGGCTPIGQNLPS
jgi:hypothetical protein